MVHNGCVFRDHRVVVPSQLRSPVLNELHHMHTGIERMRRSVRGYYWWPNIDLDIANFVAKCSVPVKTRRVPYNSNLQRLKEADYPFPLKRLHLDFCHASGRTYLVALDAFSNFVNIERSHSTSVNDAICALIKLFKFLGLPTFIVTDNASCFKGDVFKQFLERHGIRHILTSYHSQSNGAAERVIASFKHFISKNGDIQFVEHMFCFHHNFMPLATTVYPPAK